MTTTRSFELFLHVFEEITEDDLAVHFANTFGSKWFTLDPNYPPGKKPEFVPRFDGDQDSRDWVVARGRIANTPSCYVGDLTYLQAQRLETVNWSDPDAVLAVMLHVGEDLAVLDETLHGNLVRCLGLPFKLGASNTVNTRKFLDRHMGERLFTVCW